MNHSDLPGIGHHRDGERYIEGSGVGLSELICLLCGREGGRKMEWREDFDINANRDILFDMFFVYSVTFKRQKGWTLTPRFHTVWFCVWEVRPEFNARTCVSLRKNRYATTNMHEKHIFVFVKGM